jgi:hypothetical protein
MEDEAGGRSGDLLTARIVLAAVLAVSGALLAARGLLGPLAFPVRVNSPMNLEGIFALAFLVLLLTKDQQGTVSGGRAPVVLLAIFAAAAYAGSLNFPLLADDYSHIWNARHANAAAIWAHFTVPEIDHFFRPAVYCSYALDALWAGLSPVAWRAGNLALHVVNTVLVYALCRTIGLGRWGAFAGALIFGLHGSGPEAVTWVGARFDLMSVMFGVGCMLAVLRGAPWWVGCGLLLLALMSKESAYMVPGLIAAVLWYRGSEVWKKIAPLVGIELAAFAYRTWLLHGIGGYHDSANGAATVLQFGFTSTLKAMLPRFWAAMIFPLNWTGGLGVVTGIWLALAIAALGYAAWRGADRRTVLLGIGMATICSLPVHQFLSIGPDLEKSRVLYFASVGLAVLVGAIFERMDWKLAACGAALSCFQLAALENNLGHWRQVGQLAARTCVAAARAADGPIAVEGLPNVVDGVYFLHTGFPECVKFLKPDAQVFTEPHAGARTFVWDPQSRTLNLVDR